MIWKALSIAMIMLAVCLPHCQMRTVYTPQHLICGIEPCSHSRQYWEIEGKVYNLYSLPVAFEANGNIGITLTSVDRRMDNWRLQCFCIDPTSSEPVNYSEQQYNFDFDPMYGVVDTPSPEEPSLSFPRGPVLNHGLLEADSEGDVTLSWHYLNRTPDATAESYTVHGYSLSPTSSSSNMQYSVMFEANTTLTNISISSDSVTSNTYFQVTAVLANSSNTSLPYWDSMDTDGKVEDIANNGNDSVTIVLSERLNGSMQLIWWKDAVTQCMCPLLEQLISRCACNTENENNTVAIVGNHTNNNNNSNSNSNNNNSNSNSNRTLLTISNITPEMSRGLHLVSLILRGDGYWDTIRSTKIIYRIGKPQTPQVNLMEDTICLSIPYNPVSAETYEVSMTDNSTGLLLMSGVYNRSNAACLNISHLCGRQLQLTITARNSIGREAFTQSIATGRGEAECTDITSTSAAIAPSSSQAASTAAIAPSSSQAASTAATEAPSTSQAPIRVEATTTSSPSTPTSQIPLIVIISITLGIVIIAAVTVNVIVCLLCARHHKKIEILSS